MQKSSNRPTDKNGRAVKALPLTLQQQLEKWFLPVLFVAVGAVIVWTLVNGYLTHGK
jgi:cytochrome c-type biogenesis protein CcmH/NrfF